MTDPVGPRLRPTRVRGTAVLLVVGLVVLLAVTGHLLGRASPSGSYRPVLEPDALKIGCYPLPGGAGLDFAYVLRRDDTVTTQAGPRRRLVLQWSLLDEATVLEHIRDAFVAVGLTARPRPGSADLVMTGAVANAGREVIRVRLAELEDDSPDPIVRRTAVLDLPVAALASSSPDCTDPWTTKRFEAAAS